MVRPRASEQNIRIALEFADVMMIRTTVTDEYMPLVALKGRQSIHAAFAACLPQLTRNSNEKSPKNRHGVAVMELNKALKAAGLKIFRRKIKIINGRWRSKVRWFN